MKKIIYICITLICCPLIIFYFCTVDWSKELETSRSPLIEDNTTTRTIVGEPEWHYLTSPSGYCYEIVIMIESVGTQGFGFMGMERVPLSFCKENDK